MYFDEPPAKRVSKGRANEVLQAGVKTLATGCPFCLNMMTDALGSSSSDDAVQVRDVSEILLEAQEPSSLEPAVPSGSSPT
ncbi:MAG: hypothetical protein FJ404_16225 [Verrucomicrobia bacterium]|nr:hypothetical protein [Verrucomicrobiota bacterium]